MTGRTMKENWRRSSCAVGFLSAEIKTLEDKEAIRKARPRSASIPFDIGHQRSSVINSFLTPEI